MCWTSQTRHHRCQCCSFSSSPSIPHEGTFEENYFFFNSIRMLLLWRDYFHRINLQILWLTPQHPQPILCPGFPRRRRTCSRHHQLEPTTSKERLVRVWVWVPDHLVNSEEFLNCLSNPRHSRLQACHVFNIQFVCLLNVHGDELSKIDQFLLETRIMSKLVSPSSRLHHHQSWQELQAAWENLKLI